MFLQTPTLPLGIYTLKLTISQSGNYPSITPTMFIVQNKTQDRNLDVVPSISRILTLELSAHTTFPQQTQTIISRPDPSSGFRGRYVAAICVGVFVFAVIMILVGCHVFQHGLRRKNSVAKDQNGDEAIPFPNAQSGEPARLRIAQYETREKTNKYRLMLGIAVSGPANQIEDTERSDGSHVEENHGQHYEIQSLSVRYQVHDDGGQVIARHEEEQVVELPPVYTTVITQSLIISLSHSPSYA